MKALLTGFSRVFSGPTDPQPHQLAKKTRSPGSYNLLFVSPSQRENSTFEQAHQNLNSHDMKILQDAARQEPSVSSIRPAIGYWKDGAEESNAIHLKDPGTLDHLAATLGSQFNQKGVIYFKEDHEGPDVAHLISIPEKDPDVIHNHLWNQHGIEYKTIVPTTEGALVHLLDFSGTLAPSARQFTEDHKGRIVSIPGHIHSLGGDTREEAQVEYNKILNNNDSAEDPVKLARPGDLPHNNWKQVPSSGSGNLLYHAGPYIVKATDKHGDPLTEVNGARAMEIMGLPHIQAHAFEHGGVPHIALPYLKNAKTIRELTPEDVSNHQHHFHPAKVVKLATAEWLIRADDRHSGNYLFHPDRGIVPIDFGRTFHSMLHVPVGREEEFMNPFGFDGPTDNIKRPPEGARFRMGLHDSGDMNDWHLMPEDAASYALHPYGDPYTPGPTRIPPGELASLLPHKERVAHLAAMSALRLGPKEAEHAAAAVRHRFDALQKLLSHAGNEPVPIAAIRWVLPHYASHLTKTYMQSHNKTAHERLKPFDYPAIKHLENFPALG